jgi:hypothetical protein
MNTLVVCTDSVPCVLTCPPSFGRTSTRKLYLWVCREHGWQHAHGGKQLCSTVYPEQLDAAQEAVLGDVLHLGQHDMLAYIGPAVPVVTGTSSSKLSRAQLLMCG